MRFNVFIASIGLGLAVLTPASAAETGLPANVDPDATVVVHLDKPDKAISPDLWGIFFEDINDAADGGLYAELVQNRSFEYSTADNPAWHALTSWELITRGGGKGALEVRDADPLHPNNPHHASLSVVTAGDGVGISNAGFGGIALRTGAKYDISIFARQTAGEPADLVARLERADGGPLSAEVALGAAGKEWKKLTATLVADANADQARLVLLAKGPGTFLIDMVSLFPQETFKGRKNGLRADLAQTIADLKPRFVRFPGGCVAHGDGLGNMYRWKDTIGPVEQRKGQRNLWGYHQSYGLGYFEYFQFCEDIGAMPLPVVPAGVSCQFARSGPQKALPMSEMTDYVQEVLDLVEYANGPVTSTWGAKRAAAGHPEPFNLKYLAVGNEEHITPAFRERFGMIYQAVGAKHPEIVVIGTAGPGAGGRDYDNGWQFANEIGLSMMDEHYYQPPAWFLDNLGFYDKYDRTKAKVYLGEYAAHDAGRRATLRSALSEAAYMTSLERNGDVVQFASYAPLLGKIGRTAWDPNLIYFTNNRVVPTINYHVQRLFSVNVGDRYVPSTIKGDTKAPPPLRGGDVFLGTWNTQAEFDQVRVVSGGKPVFEESFEGPATNWRTDGGQWQTSGGTYHQVARAEPALSRATMKLDPGDQTLRLRARKTGGAEGFLIGFGSVDAGNYYWWNLGGWNNTQHAVEKAAGGGARRIVGRPQNGRIETDRWYDIKISRTGNAIRCYLDGKLMQEFTDPGFQPTEIFAASTVRDSKSGDLIVKLVNIASKPRRVRLELSGQKSLVSRPGILTVVAGEMSAVNSLDAESPIEPVTSEISVANSSIHELPASSLNVIRIHHRGPE